jgi:hypothetical protein
MSVRVAAFELAAILTRFDKDNTDNDGAIDKLRALLTTHTATAMELTCRMLLSSKIPMMINIILYESIYGRAHLENSAIPVPRGIPISIIHMEFPWKILLIWWSAFVYQRLVTAINNKRT